MTRGTMRVQPQLLAEMFNYGMTDEGSLSGDLSWKYFSDNFPEPRHC